MNNFKATTRDEYPTQLDMLGWNLAVGVTEEEWMQNVFNSL